MNAYQPKASGLWAAKGNIMKYLLFLFMLAVPGGAMFAQATAAAPAAPAADNAALLPQYMTWALAGIGAFVFLVAMVYVIKVNQFLYKRIVEMEAAKAGVLLPEEAAKVYGGDDFWTRLRKKYWSNPVPLAQEGEILLEHDHDGIFELDNSLPPWWINMFYITILWAVGYMFYYHWGGGGPSSGEEYKQQMERAKKEMAVALANQANAVDESNVTALTDPAMLGEGELIFKNNCVACHGQKGEGLVGPNFTDEYWIHGGGIKNIFKTIKNGVPDKGMISWAAQLRPSDMQKVASYILTLKGTNPPNPKAPQGTIWTDEAAVSQDSTKRDTAKTVSPGK